MATEEETRGGFGQVSQLRGAAFRYVALAASLFGIVMLAALLANAVFDAFGLDAASGSWYLAYAVGAGLPALVVAAYGYRNRAAGAVSLRTLAILVVGTFVALGLAVMFVIFDAQAWFVYYTFAVLPATATFVYARSREDARAPFLATGVLVAGAVAGTVVWNVLFTYPVDWTIYLWTFVVPAAAAVATLYRRRTGSGWRRAALAGLGVVVGGGVVGFTLQATGLLDPGVGIFLYLTPVLPAVVYARDVLVGREGRAGLLAPVVLAAGVAVGWLLAGAIGATGPESWLDWQFLTSPPSQTPTQAGLYPAIVGSVFVIVIVAVVSFVLGVGAAVYLEEYAPSSGPLGWLTRLIRINISNLAGVPSVVYGLLGLAVFVNLLGLGFGTVVVAGFTLSLLILPIVIISAQEAIRSVPSDQRQASLGMGATRWQTIRNVVLPRSLPGVLTGTILSLSRAIGETAPLLMIGAPNTVFSPPTGLASRVSVMPLQVFHWAFAAQEDFRVGVAAAGVVTLLVVLLAMNSMAILLRNRYQRSA